MSAIETDDGARVGSPACAPAAAASSSGGADAADAAEGAAGAGASTTSTALLIAAGNSDMLIAAAEYEYAHDRFEACYRLTCRVRDARSNRRAVFVVEAMAGHHQLLRPHHLRREATPSARS